jgi:hypothetical protein
MRCLRRGRTTNQETIQTTVPVEDEHDDDCEYEYEYEHEHEHEAARLRPVSR